MNSRAAFAKGEANRGEPMRVFDWDKAATLIRERKPAVAGAGLAGDWEWTGGIIYADGKPVSDGYTYLASTWALPLVNLDGEEIGCWRWEADAPGWDAHTQWPATALAILEADVTPGVTRPVEAADR